MNARELKEARRAAKNARRLAWATGEKAHKCRARRASKRLDDATRDAREARWQ